MTVAHTHPDPAVAGLGLGELIIVTVALPAAAAYLLAAARLRRRGDAWSWRRDVSFTVGNAALIWATLGTLRSEPFTAHMAQHLTVGMAAPLLLVLARPLTLVLRTLPPGTVRSALLAVMHSRLIGWLVIPPVAALLDVGGLWLLHRTELFAATGHRPLLHAGVYAHVLVAGLLFTAAVCQLDPVRRRWSPAVRGATLLAAGAAHNSLAKGLYATPPPGTSFTAADVHTGSQLMYYGGDLVEIALAATLAVQWYTATGRADSRRGRDTGEVPRTVTTS